MGGQRLIVIKLNKHTHSHTHACICSHTHTHTHVPLLVHVGAFGGKAACDREQIVYAHTLAHTHTQTHTHVPLLVHVGAFGGKAACDREQIVVHVRITCPQRHVRLLRAFCVSESPAAPHVVARYLPEKAGTWKKLSCVTSM